ncbi:MAG TPA: dTMP kinase [Solirubrobacterales bacterium]|nr:dTMP kinase [Solirubrobacterales bacterium]
MFVTLEGIDGSGKTTQAELLAEALGDDTVLVREPGGTQASERIRELVADPTVELDPAAELLLFCAARAQLVAEVIRPALDAGRHVVSDRFSDSTAAYQGAARGVSVEVAVSVNLVATGRLTPDVTVLLRIDPELAATRAFGEDRFEREGLEFQRLVAEAYERLARSDPGRIKVVDAEGDVDEVHARVMEAVGAP